MSEVRANTISAANGTSPVTLTKQHAAKAWVYFDTLVDNPPVSRGSFGVSTLTDNNTEIDVNLSSAMSDLFFCPVAGGGKDSDNPSNRTLANSVKSTTVVDTEMYVTSNAQSTGQCHIAVLGDLA